MLTCSKVEMAVIPTRLCGVATCLVLASCSGGPSRHGIFNNVSSNDKALSEHKAAWLAQLGSSPTGSKVLGTVHAAGGGCEMETARRLVCAANVKPRWPSIITTQIFWTTNLSRQPDGSFDLDHVGRTELGFDL